MSDKAVRVLVVDDNQDMRFLLKTVLDGAGYETYLAQNGSRALELQREHPVDVLVTDIFMPEGEGMETIERFKAEFPETRVVAMSGGGSSAAMKSDYLSVASAVGADATLRKPFQVEKLLSTLKQLLSDRAGKVN